MKSPNTVALCDSDEKSFVVKLFGWRSKFHFYFLPFIQSRAQVSYTTAHNLVNAGSRTPQPIFVMTKRWIGWIQLNVYISEAVDPHTTLRNALKSGIEEERIPAILHDLGENLARMHNAGIFHRDLTSGNFLVDDQNRTYIIDLNRSVQRQPTTKRRLKDLAKIYFGEFNLPETGQYIDIFFNSYSDTSGVDIFWQDRYKEYREKLIRYRSRRKKIKSIIRRK